MFSNFTTDGGLLTISRYPIVYNEFYAYQYPAVLSDDLSYKGTLYTKIDLTSVKGGRHLHLF